MLLTLNEAVHTGANNYYAEVGTEYIALPPTDGVYADGVQVWNIYPYDAQGRMLHDVRLYDQDGTPLSAPAGRWSTRRAGWCSTRSPTPTWRPTAR